MTPRAAWYLVTKAERAKLHLDAFNGHVSDYMKESYTVTPKYDAENKRRINRFQFRPFKSVLGMELGEFLYCLRSGLDQMAWQMAKFEARRDSPRDLYFPITDDLSTPDRRRNYRRTLNLFPDDVAVEVDAVQPHKGPNPAQDHPLWQLNKLCNLDKHVMIPIHSRGINVFCPNVPGATVEHFDEQDALEVGVPEEHENVLDQKRTSPDPIEIGEWNSDWRLPIHRLSDIHGFIARTVIPRFEHFNLAAAPAEQVRVYKSIPIDGG